LTAMPKHFSRPHIGKQPMRFYFRAQDISVSLPGIDVRGSIILVWKRGYRRTATEPFEVTEELSSIDGSLTRTATTVQDLAQICTMFKNSRSGAFESKVATFTLRSEDKKLATATIDLSAYATPDMTSNPVELSLLDGAAILKFTLASHWLKNMPGSKNDSGDDDASSMHSFGSCTDADEEDSVLSTSSSFSNTSRRALASRLSGQSPAHVIPPASAQKSSSERHYAPMASTERAKRSGEAEAAIEAQWEQAEGKLRDAQDNTALRGEIEQLKATLKHARKDAKYLRERMEQMAAENRVLRRDPRKGKRDAVIEQLEVELQRKEQVRAALAADACARRRR